MTARKEAATWALVAMIVLALMGAGVVTVAVRAQDGQSKAPPTLTQEQKLTITALQQSIEIYRLREQVAMQQLQTVLSSLKIDGYELNSKLEYVPSTSAQKDQGAKPVMQDQTKGETPKQ
jgi:hypothetical protein